MVDLFEFFSSLHSFTLLTAKTTPFSPYKMQMDLIFYTHLICFAWISPFTLLVAASFPLCKQSDFHAYSSVCVLCTFFSRTYLRMRVKMHTAVRWYRNFFRIWFEHLLNSKRLISMWVSWKSASVRCTSVDGLLAASFNFKLNSWQWHKPQCSKFKQNDCLHLRCLQRCIDHNLFHGNSVGFCLLSMKKADNVQV